MRVEFGTLVELKQELEAEKSNISRPVRFRIHEQASPKSENKLDVYCIATAVIDGSSGAPDTLAEVTVFAGCDYVLSEAADAEAGTEAAQKSAADFAQFCEGIGLEVRPGKWEIF